MDKWFTRREESRWSPDDMEIFRRPLCLISAKSEFNNTGEETRILLRSEQHVFDQIAKIDWPVVVVAVVGLYRTGKSYLMNRLANSSTGFALGDTIESKTKGIWAWCKIHPEKPKTVLLLLDTEGLGDVDKGDPSHDNKIFTLATLLCNCLVYNMKGAFDNDAVGKLTFVTEMAKNIKFRGESSKDNKALNLILPDFVLCLRDFSLKLIKDGKKISENDYLEISLADKKSKAAHFNQPRECIRENFRKRVCFAFPVPGDGDVLENLETLSFNDLSSRFKETTVRFVSYIYSIPPKELLVSKPINGQMFVTLAERYVTAIAEGAVPDVDDAFSAVAKIENAKIEKKTIEQFNKKISTLKLPVSATALSQLYTDAQQSALQYLRENVVNDKDAIYENQAKMKMDNVWNKIEKDNNEKVKQLCKDKLDEHYKKYLDENIRTKEYEKGGGYRRYQHDVEELRKKYTSALRGFSENEILGTWHSFLERMKETETKIVKADENLSYKDKQDEQKRSKERMEKLLKDQEKAYKDSLEKQERDLKKHYEKLLSDRIEQQNKESEKYEALAKEKLAREEAEREIERNRRENEARKKSWLGARVWNAIRNK